MPMPKMAFWYDEMAVRLILWQNVERFGFAVIFHEKDGSAIKLNLVNTLNATAGKKSYTPLNVAEFSLFLHNANGRLIDRYVI